MVKKSIKRGFSFGLTSGIITTLGLIIGLYSSTNSKIVVISGILVIAIADALSDSVGMHISDEGEKRNTNKEIWESSISTFCSKFIFSLSFVIPVLLFSLATAVIISIIWGFLLISTISFYIAKKRGDSPYNAVIEHSLITILVIIITYLIGKGLHNL